MAFIWIASDQLLFDRRGGRRGWRGRGRGGRGGGRRRGSVRQLARATTTGHAPLSRGPHQRAPCRGGEGDGLCSSFYYCIVLYFTYLYSQCESSASEWDDSRLTPRLSSPGRTELKQASSDLANGDAHAHLPPTRRRFLHSRAGPAGWWNLAPDRQQEE